MNSTGYLPLQSIHNNRRVDATAPSLNMHAELLFSRQWKWGQQVPQSLKGRSSAQHPSASLKQEILLW